MSRINGFSANYFPMQSLWIGEILLLIFSTFSGITSTAYMMVLRQQGCYAQTYVAGTGYCYCYIFKIIHHDIVISKIIPSFFTIKEGSTSHPCPLSSGAREETALRCSEPLRSKVGGPSKVFAILCGMGPPYKILTLSNQ